MARMLAFAMVLALTACVEAPQVPTPVLSGEPVTVTPLAGTQAPDSAASPIAAPTIAAPGLESREPDLCRAIDYVPYLGKPGALIDTLALTQPYRIVPWRGIEPQEYVAGRIVFRLDAAGNIYNIDCG
ncbi:hypothetical protein [Phaeovulum sp.]|uniref:hypothetical protein n=1 Tax=Phaeovulum sp. TaxID=2934796 RepID=UPI003568640B